MPQHNHSILLTGASGQLGRAVVSSGFFEGLLTPTRQELDITEVSSVSRYCQQNDFGAIIHAAALARMALCERDPIQAININILGTANLVKAALEKEAASKQKIYFIYISTDGVYASIDGNYKEIDPTIPYNTYGWTKMGGECVVHALSQFCIVRTRFFDPKNLRFESYATDSYTSSLPVAECVRALATLYKKRFVGTVNVGGKRISDYEQIRAVKRDIKPCTLESILQHTSFAISRDASLDTSLWRKIKCDG